MKNKLAKNTDKELWRRDKDDYYSTSVHVTKESGIGIQVGGKVIVKAPKQWHKLVNENQRLRELLRQSQEHINYLSPFASKDDIDLHNDISKLLKESEAEDRRSVD